MKSAFVKTSNYERLMGGFRQAENRGAREATFIFVHGHPGVGKTRLVESVAPQEKWLMLRAKQGWTPSAFLRALADHLKVETNCRSDTLFRRLLDAMGHLGFPPIVIDEVQFCAGANGRWDTIEKLRDFTDFTKSPAILVAGHLSTWDAFSRLPHLASRVSAVVELLPYSVKDVTATFAAICDVEVAADVCERVTKESFGLSRLVANAIKAVESFAETNGAAKVTAKDLAGVTLCIDFKAEMTRAALARADAGPGSIKQLRRA